MQWEGEVGGLVVLGVFQGFSEAAHYMREATSPSPSTQQKTWSHLAWVEVRESVGVRCHTRPLQLH